MNFRPQIQSETYVYIHTYTHIHTYIHIYYKVENFVRVRDLSGLFVRDRQRKKRRKRPPHPEIHHRVTSLNSGKFATSICCQLISECTTFKICIRASSDVVAVFARNDLSSISFRHNFAWNDVCEMEFSPYGGFPWGVVLLRITVIYEKNITTCHRREGAGGILFSGLY